MNILVNLAKLCAILAGVLLTLITLMTCGSLIGRNTFGATIVGDFELSAAAAGAAVAMFLPWCQLRRGNIIVDFFTKGLQEATNERLDRLGALLYALVMALVTWRSAVGAASAWASQSGTMIIGFPEWIIYAAMLPPLALCVAIGLAQAAFGLDAVEAP